MTPDDANRPRYPLRHPRARHGRGRERHGRVGPAALRRHVLRVQRLHAARGAARRDHADEGRFVWTHDSVGVGEDGPTHQPIEQLASLRAMPGLRVIRPADANEVAAAWRVHLDGDGPDRASLLTRQKVPVLDGTAEHARRPASPRAPTRSSTPADARPRARSAPAPRSRCASRRATRSPSTAAVRCASCRCRRGSCSRSSPTSTACRCCRRLPDARRRSRRAFGWERYADDVVSIDRFGASAPGDVVLRELGITPEHVVERALALLGAGGDVMASAIPSC